MNGYTCPVCMVRVLVSGDAANLYFREKAEADLFIQIALKLPEVTIDAIHEMGSNTASSALEAVQDMIREAADDEAEYARLEAARKEPQP